MWQVFLCPPILRKTSRSHITIKRLLKAPCPLHFFAYAQYDLALALFAAALSISINEISYNPMQLSKLKFIPIIDNCYNRQLFTTQSRLLTTLWKEAFENILGQGENAGNHHFLLFPNCFYCSQNKF